MYESGDFVYISLYIYQRKGLDARSRQAAPLSSAKGRRLGGAKEDSDLQIGGTNAALVMEGKIAERVVWLPWKIDAYRAHT